MYTDLFFDLDHTLWDFEAASEATWRQLWAVHNLAGDGLPGFDAFFERYNHHNTRMWQLFREGSIDREDLRWHRIRDTFADFGLAADPGRHLELSEAYLELLPTETRLMPGTMETLEYCASRYTLHLITNGFELTQQRKIAHAGLAHFFSEIITSERSACLKPHRAMFDFALHCSGADCKGSLMIGDSLEVDVRGAMDAGWDAVYYNPAGVPHTEQPTYEITDLRELRNIV